MSRNNKTTTKEYYLQISICLFILLTVSSFINFENTLRNSEYENKKAELVKTAQIKSDVVHKRYEAMVKVLKSLAVNFLQYTDNDFSSIENELSLISDVGYFSYVGVADIHGVMIDSHGNSGNVSDREYFINARDQKRASISDIIESSIFDGKDIQIIAYPILRDDHFKGIVFGVLDLDDIDILLDNESGSHIYTQVVDNHGNYITINDMNDALREHSNVLDDFNTYEFTESNQETIVSNMEHGKSGIFAFNLDNQSRVSAYMPLDIGNYYIFSTSNSDYIDQKIADMTKNTLLMLAQMSLGTLILFYGIYKHNNILKRQLILSHNEAMSNQEIVQLALAQSNDYLFTYDITTKIAHQKGGKSIDYLNNRPITDVIETMINRRLIDTYDQTKLLELFQTINTKESASCEIKVLDNQTIQWFKISLTNIYDSNHKIINTIGIVEDVSDAKIQEVLTKASEQERNIYKEKAEHDSLTGLLNPPTFKIKVNQILKTENHVGSTHLFLIIDIDNFKNINDTYGHPFGDKVLITLAKHLQNTFRKTDLIARLGGDEFAVLLVNAGSYETMVPTLQKLCTTIQKTFETNDNIPNLTISMGVSSAPNQGNDFDSLYKKSDKALYSIKQTVKNGFALFKDHHI